MYRVLKPLTTLGIVCLVALGCREAPKRPALRPPKEDFHVPPDGLFKEPVKYPDEMLNNVTPRRKSDDKFAAPQGLGSGAGGAMTGAGAMSPR